MGRVFDILSNTFIHVRKRNTRSNTNIVRLPIVSYRYGGAK